jgi:uncharacterized protein
MKVKVGAINIAYAVTITFLERAEDEHRAVLSVSGKERQGAGTVQARVTASLSEDGSGTTATMVTNVKVTGRVAQFGRGIIGDVSAKLTQQFARCLGDQLAGPEGSGEAGEASVEDLSVASASTQTTVPAAAQDELDLGAALAGPVLRRMAPLLAVVLGFLFVRSVLRRSGG